MHRRHRILPERGHRLPRLRSPWRLLVVLLPLSLLACGGGDDGTRPPPVIENGPPRVQRIDLLPPRVHASEEIFIRAVASDPDGDRLGYFWYISRGSLPSGNFQAGVTWRTPEDRGRDTLTVRVTDYEDTVFFSTEVQEILPAPPTGLRTISYASSVDLRWEASPDEGIQHWKGYEVYVAARSLAGLSDDSLAVYLLNPEPIPGPNRILRVLRLAGGDPLRPGVRYYFHLRSLRTYADRQEISPAGDEVDLSPRPEWINAQFTELLHPWGPVALDLSDGILRSLDPSQPEGVALRDVYVGTEHPDDSPGELMLKSVSRLQNRNTAWAARQVLIKPIGLDWTVATTTDDGWSDEVPVERQAVYALKTPEGNFAKLWVTDVRNGPPRRQLQIKWAYQTISGYPSF